MDETVPFSVKLKVDIEFMLLNMRHNIRHNIKIWYNGQVGFMISWGKNWEDRPYISIDIPFLAIQIFLKK